MRGFEFSEIQIRLWLITTLIIYTPIRVPSVTSFGFPPKRIKLESYILPEGALDIDHSLAIKYLIPAEYIKKRSSTVMSASSICNVEFDAVIVPYTKLDDNETYPKDLQLAQLVAVNTSISSVLQHSHFMITIKLQRFFHFK